MTGAPTDADDGPDPEPHTSSDPGPHTSSDPGPHPSPEPGPPAPPGPGPHGGRWTTPVPDAEPDWAALGEALRAVRPHELFRWRDAHRLPDGTRVDEFVRRGSCALLFLAEDGRAWSCRGVAPGAVGPSVLLDGAPPDELVRVLVRPRCGPREAACLGEGREPTGA